MTVRPLSVTVVGAGFGGRNTTHWPEFTFVYPPMTRRFDPSSYVASEPA